MSPKDLADFVESIAWRTKLPPWEDIDQRLCDRCLNLIFDESTSMVVRQRDESVLEVDATRRSRARLRVVGTIPPSLTVEKRVARLCWSCCEPLRIMLAQRR